MRSRFNSIEGNKIRTIRMTKYVPGNDGQMLPTWMTVEEVYQCLRDHLEDVGMLPDEYFNINSSIRKNCSLKAYYYYSSSTEHGNSEGIFFEIAAIDGDGNRGDIITGKTLGDSPEDYLRMARIAAECCIMLNGGGSLIEIPDDIRNYLDLKRRDADIKAAKDAFVEYAKDELVLRNISVREAVIEDNRSEFGKAAVAGLDIIVMDMMGGRIETESLENYSCTREQFRAFCTELLENEGFKDGIYASMTDELWEFHKGINKARKFAHENGMAFDEAPYDPDDYDENGGDLNEYAYSPSRMSPEDYELLQEKRHEESERVVEIRKLGHDQLRQLCIDMDWCNHVDNDRYNELLEYADKADITSADILYIAQRIDEFTADNDYNGHVDSICCEIARRCWPMFTIREPNDE